MNTLLFDLDGTLLPMNQDQFTSIYFRTLLAHFKKLDIDDTFFTKALQEGITAMITNDGTCTNETRFFQTLHHYYPDNLETLTSAFYTYYETDFQLCKEATWQSPYTPKLLQILHQKGYRIIIATNPVFPKVATYQRIQWAGFHADDVECVTTFDTSSYCKPNLCYYKEIINQHNLNPSDCLMVGNDVNEDMQVDILGLKRYLITDCLINSKKQNLSSIPHGSMEQFYQLICTL